MARNHPLHRYSVLAYRGNPIMVTRVGGDGTTRGDSTVHYDRVTADGSLKHGGHINGYEVEATLKSGELRYIDHATVDIRVKLPPEWQERLAGMEAAARKAAAEEAAVRDEWADEVHPSFGIVVLTRSSTTGARLFGSPFKHHTVIGIDIHRAVRHRSLSNDRVHSGSLIASIAMSEAQFAHFVSSVALGEGTPCTLEYVGSERMPEPPPEAETERFHEDAKRAFAKAGKALNDALAQAQALLEKPSVTKADRREIETLLKRAVNTFTDHLPFTIERFDERMEKIVIAGKHEIDAYAQHTVQRLGEKALAGAPTLALTAGEKKGD